MIVKNVTITQLEQALSRVNEKYNGNVCWKRVPEYIRYSSTRLRFTLTVKDSRGPGTRIGRTGRRIRAACWHVHGDFFDTLLDIEPRAVISTGRRVIDGQATTIYKNADGGIIGNWQDWNIGSYYYPFYYSDACRCNE